VTAGWARHRTQCLGSLTNGTITGWCPSVGPTVWPLGSAHGPALGDSPSSKGASRGGRYLAGGKMSSSWLHRSRER